MHIAKTDKKRVILVDPDKVEPGFFPALRAKFGDYEPDLFLVGGSFLSHKRIDQSIDEIKRHTGKPVVLFPGDYAHLTPAADAVLFLTLLSGRNPEYLAGQQVKAAPLIRQWQLPVIPTAYLLVDGGQVTSVQYVTQTLPLPPQKSDLVIATALAGQLMGMQAVYLEAGSGAARPVPVALVREVSRQIDIPLIVGGGIRDPELTETYWEAGANWVVMGTAWE